MSIPGPGADCNVVKFEPVAVMGWELEERGEQFIIIFAYVRNGNHCNQRVNCDQMKNMAALFCIFFIKICGLASPDYWRMKGCVENWGFLVNSHVRPMSEVLLDLPAQLSLQTNAAAGVSPDEPIRGATQLTCRIRRNKQIIIVLSH